MADETVHCPHCGAELLPGNRFCTGCGGTIPEVPWQAEETPPAAEVRPWAGRLALLIVALALIVLCTSIGCVGLSIAALYLSSG